VRQPPTSPNHRARNRQARDLPAKTAQMLSMHVSPAVLSIAYEKQMLMLAASFSEVKEAKS
jgi:hypothetical protein